MAEIHLPTNYDATVFIKSGDIDILGRESILDFQCTISEFGKFGISSDSALHQVGANKCIGDDTKAAARQSLNCIKNKKI